ncbi:MAG: glycosyltransferase family 39 protein [Candidatus Niyogibacteria bacterium]|nr:MAG: glycosyltransferase family 39 protein [Candidatus Niyogibacteria bacterium]
MTNRRVSNIIAFLMLVVMFVLMFFSSLNDSAVMDELAHIPAGYSYLTQKDYRLNPEHPPLIKDLAAFPLLFLNLNFPTDVRAWTEDINGQWDMGRIFLYESGNNPDRILFWSRLPMMLLALLFGWLIFSWSRRIYGDKVGLLTLLFFSFSPTFIAHSRYVTTDLAASFGFFIAIVSFVRYLELPDIKRLIIVGASLGIALLLKFSLVILIPLFVIIGVLWVFLSRLDILRFAENNYKRLKLLLAGWLGLFLRLAVIFAIAGLIIILVYQFHVWNYPQERQINDSAFILSSFGFRSAVDLTLFMAEKPILKALAEYFLGLLMVIQRAAGGNTTYFLGEVASSGWWYYFPIAYILKEPLAFLFLAAISVFVAIKSLRQSCEKSFGIALEWMRDNFFLTASFIFIAVYWLQSMQSTLNIGVRHVLPTFPFIYLLVSRELMRWTRSYSFNEPRSFGEWIFSVYERYVKSLPRYFLISFLLFWMILSAFNSFPNYLSYYNGLAGGTKQGYKYITDSNYDWGQDLKRLGDFIEKNKIEKIAVDYFGGGSLEYSLKEKFVPWQSALGKPNIKTGDPEWFAVSATIRQGAFGQPVKGFVKKPEDSYVWLQGVEPVARAGQSIFIYKF